MSDTTPSAVIAVDGPAAAGKTTTSLALASALGLNYLESGKPYRIIAYEALHRHLTVEDTSAITELCDELLTAGGSATVLAPEQYAPDELRLDPVSVLVPVVASLPPVRLRVTALIRQWAAEHRRCIIEGRDIGTAVFPTAPVKFYLTAEPEVRARRRMLQDNARCHAQVLASVLRRDEADASRSTGPLRAADDAIIVDTSTLSIEHVVHRMASICGDRGLTTTPITPANHRPRPHRDNPA
ncbi:(d)CMP kinase [Amycolatopsis orientalis]|uniref:(d)CMP kinase n=1 Tax=Amycolatopsis orientalis TaxID=31958 RepID=UPI00040EB8BE|nr:(d)CMP kinase [Amycolatopsis orientalis]